jgi:nitroreductase
MSSHINYDVSSSVSDAIDTRRSLRAFLSKQVDRDVVETILSTAARAPSGTNMQPWKTYVTTGKARQQLCETVSSAFDERSGSHTSEVRYYPESWFEPYLSRRRQVGWALYDLLGIKKAIENAHMRSIDEISSFLMHR